MSNLKMGFSPSRSFEQLTAIGGASFFGGVGTLVGALIIGVLRNGLNLLDVSAYWQTVVIGTVIVVAVWMDVLRQRAARSSPVSGLASRHPSSENGATTTYNRSDRSRLWPRSRSRRLRQQRAD